MTKASFKYSAQGFKSFEIKGHAEYSEEGYDIVCAGISATVITSLNLILKLLKNKIKFSEDQVKGYIFLEIVDENVDLTIHEFIELIVDNLISALQDIEESYPNHLKVKIEK